MRKIKSIEVKKSNFFEDTKIQFSDGLNCIMGGRGSGKSTLLYFIKSAIEQDAEISSDVLYKVLKSNLGNGTINLEIEDDGKIYRITKELNEVPQPHILPNEDFVSISKVASNIECDIYEANRIEEIGRRSIDRLRLIDRKVKGGIIECETEIKKLQIDLDSNAQDIKAYNKRLAQMKDNLSLYDQVEEEFEAHKIHQPEGISESEKQVFEAANDKEKKRRLEKRFFSKTIQSLDEFNNNLEKNKVEIIDYLKGVVNYKNAFDNQEIMDGVFDETSNIKGKVEHNLNSLQKEINDSRTKINKFLIKISDLHESQEAEFVKLKQKFEQNKDYINQYHSLSKKVSEKSGLLQDISDQEKKRDSLKEQRVNLIKRLNELKQAIFGKRLDAINELNAEFEGDIKITLTFSGIKNEFEEKLKAALKGSGLQYNKIVPNIVERFTCDEFANLIHQRKIEDIKTVDGIQDQRGDLLLNALFETEEIYEIEALYCPDLPEFLLKIGDDSELKNDNYRKTDELSMGQRCTAVLPIIFAVSQNPLIIDQPEDNLDNKYITHRIHEIVRTQKTSRQMIFITHNPNIPVLSDAENNIFLLYENRKSKIDSEGSVNDVKDKIVKLLEGGKEAFNERTKIYGNSLA